MSRKTRILAQDSAPRQAPWRLTAHEVSALMQTFTAGKCLIYESDALALVLAGECAVRVEDGQVQLELPGSRN